MCPKDWWSQRLRGRQTHVGRTPHAWGQQRAPRIPGTCHKDSWTSRRRTTDARGPKVAPRFMDPAVSWTPVANICRYVSVRGPRRFRDFERVPRICGCRCFVGFRRSWTPNVPQGFVEVEASWAPASFGPQPRCSLKHRGPQTAVGQGRITQATFSCLSVLYSMLMPGQKSALKEINATRNRNVRILPFKVSIGQCAQAAQTSKVLNARVAFICSILYHTPLTKVDMLMRNIERRNSNITTWSCVYFFHRGLPFFARLMGSPHITVSRVASMCPVCCAEVAVDTTHI